MTHDSDWVCCQPSHKLLWFFSHEPHTQNLLNSNLLTYVYDSYIFSMKFIFSKSLDPLFRPVKISIPNCSIFSQKDCRGIDKMFWTGSMGKNLCRTVTSLYFHNNSICLILRIYRFKLAISWSCPQNCYWIIFQLLCWNPNVLCLLDSADFPV